MGRETSSFSTTPVRLNEAFASAPHVLLFVSANRSASFAGVARMTSAIGKSAVRALKVGAAFQNTAHTPMQFRGSQHECSIMWMTSAKRKAMK